MSNFRRQKLTEMKKQIIIIKDLDFSLCGASDKESTCQCRRPKR